MEGEHPCPFIEGKCKGHMYNVVFFAKKINTMKQQDLHHNFEFLHIISTWSSWRVFGFKCSSKRTKGRDKGRPNLQPCLSGQDKFFEDRYRTTNCDWQILARVSGVSKLLKSCMLQCAAHITASWISGTILWYDLYGTWTHPEALL